jgi:hypothetical protein
LRNRVVKIVSGGQTGADRAALDFAIVHGLEYGGFVPAGRLAEDGEVPGRYTNLVETDLSDPSERTRLNVLHSDATLVVTHGKPVGGSELTLIFAEEFHKPLLHIDLAGGNRSESAAKVKQWLESADCRTLNVAGPRMSEDDQIYTGVMSLLTAVFQ